MASRRGCLPPGGGRRAPAYPGRVRLLILDTSQAATAAVVDTDSGVRAQFFDPSTRKHAELLVPAITRLFEDLGTSVARAGVGAIVVGIGPGPYTGLRAGLATAQGLALGWGVPVHGIHSHDGIAWAGRANDGELLVATDARRKELYVSRYSGTDSAGTPRRIDAPHVVAPAALRESEGAPRKLGRGFLLYAEALGEPSSSDPAQLDTHAADLGEVAARRLAAGIALPLPRPEYLRAPDAVVPPPRVQRLT